MIRQVTQEDALALTNLLRSLDDLSQVIAETAEATFNSVNKQLERILNNLDRSLLIDEEKGVFWQAPLMNQGSEGYVAELFTHPEKGAQGSGRTLLEEVIRQGKARGCSRLCLFTMRHRPSWERGFYSKNDWEERPLAAHFINNLREKP
jgi:GNAT superfamily N-acetyltransferase